MMGRTHAVFGFLVGLFTHHLVALQWYWFFPLVVLGALFPDIDHPSSKLGSKVPPLSKLLNSLFGHRGFVHSIFFALIVCGLVYWLAGPLFGWALFIGFASHLVSDGFTKAGINYIHPIQQLRTAGFVETGTIVETVLCVMMVVGIVLKLVL